MLPSALALLLCAPSARSEGVRDHAYELVRQEGGKERKTEALKFDFGDFFVRGVEVTTGQTIGIPHEWERLEIEDGRYTFFLMPDVFTEQPSPTTRVVTLTDVSFDSPVRVKQPALCRKPGKARVVVERVWDKRPDCSGVTKKDELEAEDCSDCNPCFAAYSRNYHACELFPESNRHENWKGTFPDLTKFPGAKPGPDLIQGKFDACARGDLKSCKQVASVFYRDADGKESCCWGSIPRPGRKQPGHSFWRVSSEPECRFKAHLAALQASCKPPGCVPSYAWEDAATADPEKPSCKTRPATSVPREAFKPLSFPPELRDESTRPAP